MIHLHAAIRLDGPAGPYTTPPAWATPELLADAIRIAANGAHIDGPEVNGSARSFAFGEQIDTRVI
ncbi:replication initiator [Streptomyces sp. NPDC054975]